MIEREEGGGSALPAASSARLRVHARAELCAHSAGYQPEARRPNRGLLATQPEQRPYPQLVQRSETRAGSSAVPALSVGCAIGSWQLAQADM